MQQASTDPFNIRRLQKEFREKNGCDLPIFGYRNVQKFVTAHSFGPRDLPHVDNKATFQKPKTTNLKLTNLVSK